jgi:hypothetical protein
MGLEAAAHGLPGRVPAGTVSHTERKSMNGQQGGDPAKLTEALVTLADSIRTSLIEWRLRPMPVNQRTSTKSQPVNSRPSYGH